MNVRKHRRSRRYRLLDEVDTSAQMILRERPMLSVPVR
jgi:hypothetical protein